MQAIGLLLMFIGLLGMGLLVSGNPSLVALADPCVPNVATPSGPTTVQITRVTPAPSHVPTQLGSYPVFAPTDKLATPTPSPTPSPTPEPTATPPPRGSLQPCPTRRHHLFGDGPIELSGTGGIDVGTHRQSTPGFSQDQNQANLSMALHVARRTQRTSISLDESFGENSGYLNVAQMNLLYSTPQYSLGYGVISSSNDTQLSSGTFNRGITIGVPRGRDQIDLILGRSQGSSGESFGVFGLRHSAAYSHGLLFSQTLYMARGDASGAHNTTLDLSLGRYKSGATYRGEVGFSDTHGIAGVPDGTQMAYALHADFVGSNTSTSLGYFTIPVGYITLGQLDSSQKNFDLSHRRTIFRHGLLTFDYGNLDTNVGGTTSLAQHETVNLSLPLGNAITTQTLVNIAQTTSDAEKTNERDAGITLTEQLKSLTFNQTIQGSELTSNDGQAAAQTQYQFGLSYPIFNGFLFLQTVRSHTFGDGAGSVQTENAGSIEEPIGRKAQIAYSLSATRLNSIASGVQSTNQVIQTFSATRRFSPVVAARLMYTITKQSGLLGGAARSLNLDIIGPLAFGAAAHYGGRINPNLPAVVQGHVYLQNEASAYGLVGNRGIANVLVTLDGGITQRTDATGGFEFRFVRPGMHTVTIASGTLPPGVIPDTATQSFTIQGGQVYSIDFAAGNFAGVQGHVFEQRPGGGTVPLGGVRLTVDGKQTGYTGSDGAYQIGHLTPGRHTVSIVAESLPATVMVKGATEHQVDVPSGSLATLDWALEGLGSIQGVVLYTADAGFGDLAGAKDVYVVADPGQHAAITDEGGHFIIDNLPVGEYTLSLDQDSLPDGQGLISGPDGPVTITGSDPVRGITFKVGPVAKQVIMTFNSGSAASVQANFVPDQVPPNGVTELIVTTSAKKITSVTASGDIGKFALRYVAARKAWIARVKVPPLANGDYPVHVDVEGESSGGADTTVTVSNALHLIVAHGAPAHPHPGEKVRVVAKIAADVEAGDLVALEDGEQVKLPKPRGNVYSFTIQPHRALPLRGIIFTKRGERLPFVIQP